MAVEERALGKGTIAYAGESTEYWAAKTARLRRGRARITATLLVVAALLALWLISLLGPHLAAAHVLDVTTTAKDRSVSVVAVRLTDGTLATFRAGTDTPAVNGNVPVTVMQSGRVVEGTTFVVSMWVLVGLLTLIGLGRAVWQYRTRHLQISYV